jgi:hypothetical protein
MWSQGAQIHGFIVAQMLVLYIYKIYSLFLIPREFLVIYWDLSGETVSRSASFTIFYINLNLPIHLIIMDDRVV